MTQDNPAPSVLIFTKRYHSEILEMGGRPRSALLPPANPGKLDQWRPFTANSGTYEIAGSILIRHPIVAKNVDVMTRGTATPFELKFEDANTVWLIPMADFAATEPQSKLTRLE